MSSRLVAFAAALLLPASAAAQRPIFEPDDFIDPAMLSGPVFLSRIVTGGVWNQTDRFRPIDGDAGLVILTNSLYYDRFQFDYDHTEFVGREEAQPLRRCDCPEPVYFPTPPPRGATPNGPSAERGDTVQLALYRTGGRNTLRYRLSWTRQEVDTTVLNANGQPLGSRSGHDQSFTLDADTHFSIAGRDVWGTLHLARASSQGMPAGDRSHNEIAYAFRPPGFSAGPLLFLTKLATGVISDRGGTALNLVNPYFEAFWRHDKSKVNVHFVWSGEWTRSVEGWRANHQVAVFLDRTLYVKIFNAPYSPPASASRPARPPAPR